MVGADGVLGDKVSVKRSVIGAGCTIGAGAKVRVKGRVLSKKGRCCDEMPACKGQSLEPSSNANPPTHADRLITRLCQIINSILMNGVTVESGCHLHNTIICSKAWIGADASLRDCQARRGVLWLFLVKLTRALIIQGNVVFNGHYLISRTRPAD